MGEDEPVLLGLRLEDLEDEFLLAQAARTLDLELVPVRRKDDTAEPLATKYLPLSALARSDGWILVPADSEGYAAGAPVQVRPWP